jgi:hypothetical protein
MKSSSIYLTIISVLGWFALFTQFCLTIENRDTPIFEAVTRHFSFFTILSTWLVTLCCSFMLARPASRLGSFFSQPAVFTAITVYIVIVSVVYNIMLRPIWHPEGIQRVTDELFHSIIPALYLGFWIFFIDKKNLTWNIFPWLIFPLSYCAFVFVRGAFSGFYPYPFMDVLIYNYPSVFMNCGVLTLMFGGVSFLFVGIGKWSVKKSK